MMKLSSRYDRDDFLKFLEENFLVDFEKDIRSVNTEGSPSIQKAYSLGRSESLDLQVFEFSFAGSSKKRVTLTKDAFQIMKSHAIFLALAVFHSPDSDDWRFSLMTATPERSEKGKVALSYSNPKRLSYFLGPNAKVNTPIKFLIRKETVLDFEDLKARFSIEVVNKEFYKEISELFTRLVGGSISKGKSRVDYQALLHLPGVMEKSQTSLEFAVRLIGRVIFCWFLREKKSDQGKPLMPQDLLSLVTVKKTPDYYHKVLEPIFFEVLNKPGRSRKDEYDKEPFSSIPYLNGGLFSPHDDDFFSGNEGKQAVNHNTVLVPDKWLLSLFEVLETYNFTIDENTGFDEELSIDPEMLGRIFENLLAEINPETGESARKSTGSYYTPRVIVDYMVDESLLLYLQNKTGLDEGKLRAIISYDLNDDEQNVLTEDECEGIINALETVKILDPACGSGAFPIGALQKIVFILQQADPAGHLWFKKQIKNTSPEIRRVLEREFAHKNFDYIRKLGIIRENIYGVDIQPIATEISRLRCFLTLVVDERIQEDMENRGIEPLPNLDFKFVTANSLIGLPKLEDSGQRDMFDNREKIDELKLVRDQYFTASGIEREQLKAQFSKLQKDLVFELVQEHGYMSLHKAELTQKLTAWDPFSHKSSWWFDPEWMFGMKDGFNIVIGNPPYGLLNKRQNQKLGHQVAEEELSYYKNNPIYKPAQGGMINVYRLFVCQSIELMTNNGVFSLIFPMAFMCDISAANLRKYILDTYQIDYLEAFPERDNERKRVFEAVKMSVCILGISKTKKPHTAFPVRIHKDRYVDHSNDKSFVTSTSIKVIDPANYTIPLVNSRELKLIIKIRSKSVRLEDIGKCYTGEIDLTLDKKFVSADPSYSKMIKGAQVQKYKLLDTMSQGEIMYLNENLYLKSTKSGRSSHHKRRRIVMQGITGINEVIRLKVTIVDPPTYCANSVNYIIINNNCVQLYFLLGILNSTLTNWFFKTMSTNSNVNGYEVDNLPVLDVASEEQGKIISVVNQIFDLPSNCRMDKYEEEIDQMVYKLYGLTEDEIKIVEKLTSNRVINSNYSLDSNQDTGSE